MEAEEEAKPSLVTQRGVHFTVDQSFLGMVVIETDHGFVRVDMDDLRHFFGEYIRHKRVQELLHADAERLLGEDLKI